MTHVLTFGRYLSMCTTSKQKYTQHSYVLRRNNHINKNVNLENSTTTLFWQHGSCGIDIGTIIALILLSPLIYLASSFLHSPCNISRPLSPCLFHLFAFYFQCFGLQFFFHFIIEIVIQPVLCTHSNSVNCIASQRIGTGMISSRRPLYMYLEYMDVKDLTNKTNHRQQTAMQVKSISQMKTYTLDYTNDGDQSILFVHATKRISA